MTYKMENEESERKNCSDFSIDHILNRAGASKTSDLEKSQKISEEYAFSWMQCTRFCPPKIPRVHKKEPPQKRQLGRYPRIPFTNEQLSILEEKFQESPYLSSEEALNLSRRLQLADVKVKIWFQNRRARKRREEMGGKKEKVGKSDDSAASTSGVVPFVYISQQGLFETLEFGSR